MEHMQTLDMLTREMYIFDRGDAQRIQHLLKVHRFAQLIGHMEGLDDHTQFLVECAALVHDIGIRPAEEKYGSCSGKLQELEGPAYARPILERLGLGKPDVDRICYLIGHHHTYNQIDGLDYQILVEADFLVNLQEDSIGQDGILTALNKIFRTRAGTELCTLIYDLPTPEQEES